MISEEIQLIKQNIYDLLHNTRISKKAYLIILIGLFFTYFVGNAIINTLSIQLIEMYYLRVNDTLRMYKNDDIRMYNFNCITDTIVEVITTCNTYTLLTVHLL